MVTTNAAEFPWIRIAAFAGLVSGLAVVVLFPTASLMLVGMAILTAAARR